MNTTRPDHRLPCGAELGALLEQIADGGAQKRSPHQRGCRYCTVALDDAERYWQSVRDVAATPVEIPLDLVASIMRKIRRLIQAGWITVTRAADGTTKVAAWVVAAIAELAAERSAGVHRVGTGWGRLADRLGEAVSPHDGEQTPSGSAAYEVADQTTTVELDVVARYGPPIPFIADQLRRNIISDVRRLTTLDIDAVHIHVRDIVAHEQSDDQHL